MSQRFAFNEIPQQLLSAMFSMGNYLQNAGLEPSLRELIKYRASQINHCAPCLDMHWKDAIAHGETPQRLHSLIAWRDCPYYTDKERAALALTDALTNANQQEVEDDIYNELLKHFTKNDIANLALAVGEINVWNRLNKVFKTTPGNYQPGAYKAA